MQTSPVENQNPNSALPLTVRILLFVLLFLAAAWLIYRTFELLLLVFGAMLVGLLLSVTANELWQRIGLAYKWGVLLATILLIAFLGGLGWLFGHEVVTQIGDLGQKVPQAWERWSRSLSQNPMGKVLVDSLQSQNTIVFITNESRAIAEGSVTVLFNLLIVIAGGVFFAAAPRRYRHIFIALFPRPARPLAARTARDLSHNLSYWLLTQSASMVIMGIIFTIGLHLSGVPAASALGVLGGLSEFIPYVGPILAMIPAIVLAFAGQGSLLGVILTYLIARIVQANIITPLLTSRLVSVPPGIYIFLILGAGYAFGTFGLFFAGPLAIFFYTIWVRLYQRHFLGDPVSPTAGQL